MSEAKESAFGRTYWSEGVDPLARTARWGERALNLDLPGGPYHFAGLSTSQLEAVLARFPREASVDTADAPRAGIAAEIFRCPPADFRAVDTRGWEYTLDLAPSPAALRLAGLGFAAQLDFPPIESPPTISSGSSTGDLSGDSSGRSANDSSGHSSLPLSGILATADDGERFPGIFENFARTLVAYALAARGGALLHSAGVATARGAILFLGPSGAGKSTISRLALDSGHPVLSDDLNALVPCPQAVAKRGVEVARLPFTGNLGEEATRGAPDHSPLAALVRLKQAVAPAVRRLSTAEALAVALACSPLVNRDPFRRERLARTLEAVARQTPCLELSFRRAPDFWEPLESALAPP